MFRRLLGGLEPEPEFAPDLEKLGYFINDKTQVRAIGQPDSGFRYRITDNHRYNELNDGAIHEAIAKEVSQRLYTAGLTKLYLPQLTTQDPQTPSVPIFMTPQVKLRNRGRIIIVVNDTDTEVGCWSFRAIMSDRGLETGSAMKFTRALSIRDVGFVLMNPASLLYSHQYKRAMTLRSWIRRPRNSMQHPVHVIDEEMNRIPHNRTAAEHVKFVFENILMNPDFVDQDSQIQVIGLIDGANEVVNYLNANCRCFHCIGGWRQLLISSVGKTWSGRVSCLAMVSPYFALNKVTNHSFENFLRRRARIYRVSIEPINTVLAIPTKRVGSVLNGTEVSSPVLSLCADEGSDFMFPDSFLVVLSWLDQVYRVPIGEYRNPKVAVAKFTEPAVEPAEEKRQSDPEAMEDSEDEMIPGPVEETVTYAGVTISKSLATRAGLPV
jgi:hypothetical protein